MRYYQNQLPKKTERKKRNSKPEKLVEKDVLLWCRNAGWFVGVFEAKSVYNKSAGVYISSTMEYGTPDILGISNNQTMARRPRQPRHRKELAGQSETARN